MRSNVPLFVLGTGTGVGKTHVSCCLLEAARRHGRALGIKPVETGVEEGRREGLDAQALREAAGREEVVPSCRTFARPISPHLAAQEAGSALELDELTRGVTRLAEEDSARFTLVESAGGVFSPLSRVATNADFARHLVQDLETRLLLVAPNRIGVLHDVGAVVRAARSERIHFPVVALSASDEDDASARSNGDEILRLGLAEYVVNFPRATPTAPASLAAAEKCLAALDMR